MMTTDGRDIALIQAEVTEAHHELAEVMREQARLMIVRAGEIDKNAPHHDIEASKQEKENARRLSEDEALLEARNAEIRVRLQRLGMERNILERRTAHDNGTEEACGI